MSDRLAEHFGVNVPLFPDLVPSSAARPKRRWRPTRDQRRILTVLARNDGDAHDVFNRLDCELKRSTIDNLLDTLGEHGCVADTGKRGGWTRRGRRWVYRLTDEGRQMLVEVDVWS